MRLIAFAACAALAVADGGQVLRVERQGAWQEWWRADRAPARWTAPLATVAGGVAWDAAAPGVDWGELRLSGSGEAWRLRAIVVRIDPARVRFRLAGDTIGGRGNHWSLDSAPADAAVALNAGQFGPPGPWGWVVRDGVERQPPGAGPLAPALVVDTAGAVRIVPPDSIAVVRARGGVRQAFQSYPTLLSDDGDIPEPLRVPRRGIDLDHRDARLAVGELRDGRLLLVLTRFEGLGGALDNLPFGLTTPEMAALMGALGCRRAMLLDGGISSQLGLRLRDGRTRRWSGLRNVPLALIMTPRPAS